MDAVVDQFADLFQGRRDAYGTEEGGCVRTELGWDRVAASHLNGDNPIGVYPIAMYAGTQQVKWGCVDFDVKTKGKPSWDYEDEDGAHVAACDLQAALTHVGVTSWIERTRSYGRHVWIFSESWVTASTMRRALLTACSVAGVSTREVNPKQETLQAGKLGNYVRLPYPGGLNADTGDSTAYDLTYHEPTSRVMLCRRADLYCGIGLNYFLDCALTERTPASTLEKIAAKYKEPERPKLEIRSVAPSDLRGAYARLNSAGRWIYTNGPEDGDRSRALGYLAYQARLSGLTQTEAYQLLQSCGFNKFVDRSDEEIRLQQIVLGAWA